MSPLKKKTVSVTVVPKASANKVVTEVKDEETSYRIYVTTVPEDGKANKEVIKLLAKELGVSKSSLTILRGQTSRQKIIEIDGDV